MILVAFGANLPSPQAGCAAWTIMRAQAALGALPGLRVIARSRLWQSAPDPPSDQPRYVNAVAAYAGDVGPEALLAALHAIEARFGRVRGAVNAARTLDLDLLDMDGMLRAAPAPILPHPRLAGRAFVLFPLAEVAPGWHHPASGEGIAALIARLPAEACVSCWPLA